MQITDIHAHVFPDAIAEKASGSIGEFYRMKVYHRSENCLRLKKKRE